MNSSSFPVTEVHNLQNVKFINVIMDSYLNFNGGIERSQGQDGTQIEYPRANPTQFKVNELLQIAGVSNYSSIQERGAVLIATVIWKCNIESGCSRGIEVTRMDQSGSGYYVEKSEYYMDNGVQKRTKIMARGIRIFGRAKGYVSELSLMNIILQISSAIGLLLAAKSLTDFVMLSVFREKNHYSNMKFLKTEKL